MLAIEKRILLKHTHLVKAFACLLSQALELVHDGNELTDVHTVRERLQEVLAHVETHIAAHQVIQPAQIAQGDIQSEKALAISIKLCVLQQ